ncbi:MAG TPA: dephospho-CoA kinase [Gemmatimonadaceae bacterium]|jgi:dephospho-CoA kinase|nr:dephospho-CoA kinase [Gemmatimonadaceae bacterium]
MLIVGLTGNAASGKSSVAQLMAARGATIVDADVLARIAVEPGSPGLKAIVEHWGPGILTPDGSLDRETMRHRVFANPKELEALNAIVHPAVARLRDQAIAVARAQGARIVICDIPLLFEKDLARDYDVIVLVDAPKAVRLERLTTRRGLAQDDAIHLIAAQMPAELKRAHADFIIDNDSDQRALSRRVDAVWAALEARAAARDLA